jgi:hypothetical protein
VAADISLSLNVVKGITVDAERLAAYREQGKCRKKEAETRPTVAHSDRRGREQGTSIVLLA